MIVHYYPHEYGSLILNPENLQGITFDEEKISQMSLFNASGTPLRITDRPYTTRSSEYFHCEIDKKTWEKLDDHAFRRERKQAEDIIAKIIKQTANSSPFVQESDDTHHRREYLIVNPAA